MDILNLQKNDDTPLFLGESLGLQEYTKPRYKILEELTLLQRSQFWIETEIEMTKDVLQWNKLDKNIQDIVILNLSWQIMADSIVGRVPFSILLPYVSNPEYEGMLIQWGYFENLHSRSYSNIIKNVFPDPQAVIDQVKTNVRAFNRLEYILSAYKDLSYYNAKLYNKENLKERIYKCLITTYGLEAIQFFASFACTFALANQDILIGTADNLILIARDEAIHTRMTKAILDILANEEKDEWGYIIEECHDQSRNILEHILIQEIEWAKYIFSDNRKIINLNTELLIEYLEYVAYNSFSKIGFNDFKKVDKNPIPFINKYLNSENVQTALQEKQNTSYRIGVIDSNNSDYKINSNNLDFLKI